MAENVSLEDAMRQVDDTYLSTLEQKLADAGDSLNQGLMIANMVQQLENFFKRSDNVQRLSNSWSDLAVPHWYLKSSTSIISTPVQYFTLKEVYGIAQLDAKVKEEWKKYKTKLWSYVPGYLPATDTVVASPPKRQKRK